MAFTSEYLETLEDATQDMVSKMQYELNGVWYEGNILSSGTDGEVRMFFCEIPSGVQGTVTAVRLTDADENVIYIDEKNIVLSADVAFSFKIRFEIVERDMS